MRSSIRFLKVALLLGLTFAVPLSGWAQTAASPDSKREKEIQTELKSHFASFRELLLSEKGGTYILDDLSMKHPGCGEEVKRIYQTGGSLYSKTIDEAAIPLGKHEVRSGVKDETFYHFTTSADFMKIFEAPHEELLKNGKYEEIFGFIRTRAQFYPQNWGRVFYIAEDINSIRHWAPYGIEFRMSLKARVLDWNEPLFNRALEELGARHPQLAALCGTKVDTQMVDHHATVTFHTLLYPMAEDSGIDLIDHQKGVWFQLVSPRALIGAKALGAIGGNMRGTSFSGRTGEKFNPTVLDGSVISIISAKFAGRDVTQQAADFANGKGEVEFKIKASRFGGLEPGQIASFEIAWRCLKNGDTKRPVGTDRTLKFDQDADGKLFPLSCK